MKEQSILSVFILSLMLLAGYAMIVELFSTGVYVNRLEVGTSEIFSSINTDTCT